MSTVHKRQADELLDELARRLFEAEQTGSRILPFTREHADLTLADAYEIQGRLAALKRTPGGS